jgi:hypothetical protein
VTLACPDAPVAVRDPFLTIVVERARTEALRHRSYPREVAVFTKRFGLDLLERTIRTFVQAFIGALLAAPVFSIELPTLKAAALAGVAAAAAVVMGIMSQPVGSGESASVIPEPGPGDYPADPQPAGH